MAVSHGDAPEIAALGTVAFATNTVTTHSLALLNGWRAGPRSLNAGRPSYAVRGGVVYLSGALRQSSGTKHLFAVLPAGARPKHNLYLAVFTAGGVVGELHITVTGHAQLFGTAARTLTSLTGISYPRTS
jgi:hypothetical protein